MKRFLLTAGECYYPQSGDGDWIDSFDTREEAENQVIVTQEHDYLSRGPRKGMVKATRDIYTIRNRRVDWYDIIDIENWTRQ